MAKNKGSSLENHTKGEPIEPAFVEEPVRPITYRRQKDTNTWHSHPDCSNWPSSDYFTSAAKPVEATGKLCEECIKLHEQSSSS